MYYFIQEVMKMNKGIKKILSAGLISVMVFGSGCENEKTRILEEDVPRKEQVESARTINEEFDSKDAKIVENLKLSFNKEDDVKSIGKFNKDNIGMFSTNINGIMHGALIKRDTGRAYKDTNGNLFLFKIDEFGNFERVEASKSGIIAREDKLKEYIIIPAIFVNQASDLELKSLRTAYERSNIEVETMENIDKIQYGDKRFLGNGNNGILYDIDADKLLDGYKKLTVNQWCKIGAKDLYAGVDYFGKLYFAKLDNGTISYYEGDRLNEKIKPSDKRFTSKFELVGADSENLFICKTMNDQLESSKTSKNYFMEMYKYNTETKKSKLVWTTENKGLFKRLFVVGDVIITEEYKIDGNKMYTEKLVFNKIINGELSEIYADDVSGSKGFNFSLKNFTMCEDGKILMGTNNVISGLENVVDCEIKMYDLNK